MKHECKKCQKEFKVIAQEAKYYEKKDLPMPSECPECRRNRRRDLRSDRRLFARKCDGCAIDLMSSYPADVQFDVLCEKCYFDEVN